MKTTALLRRGLLLVPLLTGLLLEGCGETPSDEPGTIERVFGHAEMQGCGTCHGPAGDAADGPDMTTAESFRSSLVNRSLDDYADWMAVTSPCSGGGFPYISPGNPEASALLAAVSFSHSEGRCDGSYAYHDTQKATIDANKDLIADLELWIKDGAN